MLVGAAILILGSRRRLRHPCDLAIGVGLTAVVAAAFYVVYAADLLALF